MRKYKKEAIQTDDLFFGASVLMGLSGKVPCTSTFSFSDIFKFNPHPFRMRLELEGLSHGLKTCHRHVFLTAFRVPYFGASVLIGLFEKESDTNGF